MKMIVNGTERDFPAENEIGLINYGTYGNGSIDYGMRGIYAGNIARQTDTDAIAVKINGKLMPLETFITAKSEIIFITLADKEGQEMLSRTALFMLSYALEGLAVPLRRLGGSVDGCKLNYSFTAEQVLPIEATKNILQQRIDALLAQNLQIKAKKLPFYPLLRWLKAKGEVELIEKLYAQDDGGPVEGLESENFFEPLTGLAVCDLEKIQALKIKQLHIKSNVYTLEAELMYIV